MVSSADFSVLHALALNARPSRTAARNLAILPAMPCRPRATVRSLLIVIRATSFLALPAFVPAIACLVPLVIRDCAINGFASTGNRMFIDTGLPDPPTMKENRS
jgi:hypothetical protein